jgi:cyclic beta-1,2-glucan synthetase
VLDLVDKHRDATAFERATTLAWTQAQVQLHHLGIGGRGGPVSTLAGHVLYAGAGAAPASDASCGRRPAVRTVAQGISGDLPIVLLRIADIETSRHRPPAAARRTNTGG